MYRDDLAAAHARLEQVQRELADASSKAVLDRARIAQLTAELAAAQQALAVAGRSPMAVPNFLFAPRGNTVLVLGILSLVICSVMGPIAWAMGNEELRRIDSGRTPPHDRSAASAGRICG